MKKLVDQLSEDLHLHEEHRKEEEERVVLSLTSKLQIKLSPLNPGIYLFSEVCKCPEVKKEEFFIYLMRANLFGQGTLGAILGLDEEEKLLTLSAIFPYDMDYRAFKEALEDFANIIDYWRVEVESHIAQSKGGIL